MSVTRRFEFVDASSQKFWEVSTEGSSVVTRYGKIGASGQTTTKDEGSPEKARTLYEKLIREKTGKGYVEQAGGGNVSPRAAAAAPSSGGYRARFVAMVDDLQKDERFEVKKVNIGEPADPALIAQAAEAAGGTLPPGVAELYAEMNGFELVWAQVDGFHDDLQGEPEGYIDIPKIYAPHAAGGVFSDWRGSLYFSDDDPLKQIKPIDNSGGELGANTLAVFFPVPGEATIHYHDGDGELHPTGYSLVEYLDRVIVSRGYRYWTGSLCVDMQDNSSVEEFLHDAPLLFQDWKRALFKPKTEAGQLRFG